MPQRLIAVVLVASASLVAAPDRATAQWTPEPGSGYAKLWLKWLPGWQYLDGNGEATGYGRYNEVFLATYGEVGVADSVAVFWHTDLVRTIFLEDPRTGETDGHVAPGDPSLGARWRFLRAGRFVMSVDGSVRAPLATGDELQVVYADDDDVAGNPPIGRLRIGAGAWDFALTLRAGYGGDGWYVAGGAGYTIRTDGYDHNVGWSVEGGGNIGADVGLRGRVTGVHPVDVGDTPRHDSPSGLGNGTQYIGFAVEADYQFVPDWFIGLAFEGGVALIQRQTGGPVITLYAATRF